MLLAERWIPLGQQPSARLSHAESEADFRLRLPPPSAQVTSRFLSNSCILPTTSGCSSTTFAFSCGSFASS